MKKILITGIGSGFGFAIANTFILNNYSISALTKSSIKNHDKMLSIKTNFENLNQVKNNILKLINTSNQYEYIILNAGILGKIDLTKNLSIKEIKRTLDVNLFANKIIIDQILSNSIKFKSLITISSGASIKTKFGWFAYSSTKATLRFLIENYALENKNKHFISYNPGIIETNMQKKIRKINSKKIPSIKRFKQLYKDKLIQSPEEASLSLFSNLNKLLKFESGSYIDSREI